MGFLIVIALMALSLWGVFTTFRRLRRTNASRAWWFAFGLLAVVGLVGGCWFAFSFEYQVSPRIHAPASPCHLLSFTLRMVSGLIS